MTAAEADVKAICGQLIQAVEVMMNPAVAQAQRVEAFRQCEDFKKNSPLAGQCGLLLSQPEQNAIVRHFGLKIVEDIIRLRWNEMGPEEKLFLKESSINMVAAEGSLATAAHIKDGISRLVVEIVKREWPQQWPTLLQELDQLCQKGETQTEVVMLIFLRLVEDVALLQTLEQSQRRKDIYQALTAHMEQIFNFLLQQLEKHYQIYSAAKQTPAAAAAGSAKQQPYKVCQAVLNTFSSFVEWVSMNYIMANDRYLIRVLCHLLQDENLQLNAAECLLSIVSWKAGKANDRMQIMSLFKQDMMAPLFQATEAAFAKAADEDHYNVLKKMVQILVELGNQLCALWANEGTHWKEMPNKRPENFEVYLNALMAFTNHASQTVNHYVNELVAKFLRHGDISKDEVFRAFVPKWVPVVLRKCVKVGYPTKSDHPSCAFAVFDFDTDEEFSSFFGRYKIIILEGIKLVCAESPLIPFKVTEEWLVTVLSSQVNYGAAAAGKTACTVTSPTYLELDAIAGILDAIIFKQGNDNLAPIVPGALGLTRKCLDYQTPDPVLRSAILSCISSLFPIASVTQDSLLLPILTNVFESVTFTGGQPLGEQSSEVKMLRRHGCSLLVKIGHRSPKVLVPMFSHLRDKVVELRTQGLIAPTEFTTLVEALVLVSNEFANFDTQSTFVKAISESVCIQFRNLEAAFADPATFITYVGLDKPAPAAGNDPNYQNRAEFQFCLNFCLSVCRRAAWPNDINACRSGGFVVSEANGHVALRNPAWEVANSVLGLVLRLAKTMNHLWAPHVVSKLHPDFAKVLDILEAEKNTITGVGNREKNNEAKVRTPLSRMQTFLFEVYENNYHFLSQLCTTFGHSFFQLPHLAENLVGTVFDGIAAVPDYRLRAIIRMFVKNLINKCPQSCYSAVLAPVLQSLLPYMVERLTERWKHLAALRETPGFDEDNTDSREVIDDVVCRHMAREYLDVIKAILSSGGGSDIPVASLNGNRAPDNGEAAKEGTPKQTNVIVISELGRLVLQHETLGNCVTLTLLRAIVWPDSPSSVRACTLLELVIPALIQSGQLRSEDAKQIMISILSAIHELGQHEANYIALTAIAIQAYEWMRPHHPVIVEVLAQVPGCNQDDLKRFDDRMMTMLASGKENMKGGDRTKKDMFKKLINQFIGKDVAEMFKHEVVIKNLPTLQLLKARQKNASVDETEKSDIGICSLFSQNGQRP